MRQRLGLGLSGMSGEQATAPKEEVKVIKREEDEDEEL